MYNLMMDLLDLAQMENSTFKLNKAFYSLPDAILNAFQVVKHNAMYKNLELVEPTISDKDL
jgi:K+-sensing histidine kinase KdpD